MFTLTAAAKAVFVVMIGYCSIADKTACGIATGATIYKSKAACTKVVKALKKDELEKILGSGGAPSPWDAKVTCGTPKQAETVRAAIARWRAMKFGEAPPQQEEPGDRDPYPNGS